MDRRRIAGPGDFWKKAKLERSPSGLTHWAGGFDRKAKAFGDFLLKKNIADWMEGIVDAAVREGTAMRTKELLWEIRYKSALFEATVMAEIEDMAAEFYGKRDVQLFGFFRDLRDSGNKAMLRRYNQLSKAMAKYKPLDEKLKKAYTYLLNRVQASATRVAGELVTLARELTVGTSKTAITGNVSRPRIARKPKKGDKVFYDNGRRVVEDTIYRIHGGELTHLVELDRTGYLCTVDALQRQGNHWFVPAPPSRKMSRRAASFPAGNVRETMELEGSIPSRRIDEIEREARRLYDIVSVVHGRPKVSPWVSRKRGLTVGFRIGKNAYVGWVKGVGLTGNYEDYFGHYHEYAYDKGHGVRARKPAGYDEWASKNPELEAKLARA